MKKICITFFITLIVSSSQFLCSQTWGWITFQANSNEGILDLEIDTTNNDLYACGNFETVNGVILNKVCKWSAGVLSSLGGGINTGLTPSSVNCIKLYNGELYAVGTFTAAAGAPANLIAKWDGNNWSAVGTEVFEGYSNYSGLNSMEVYDGELYVGGDFYAISDTTIKSLAKWDGTSWSSAGQVSEDFGNGNVFALSTFDGSLYAAGYFDSIDSVNTGNIARWDGVSWQQLGTDPFYGIIHALTEHEGKLIIGGSFTWAGAVPASKIVSWDGTNMSPLGDGVNSTVRSLKSYKCELYVGGSFTQAGNAAHYRLAKWNGTDWSNVGNYPLIANSKISAFETYNDDLLLGGSDIIFNVGGTGYTALGDLLTWNMPQPTMVTPSFTANETVIGAGSYVQFSNTTTASSTINLEDLVPRNLVQNDSPIR